MPPRFIESKQLPCVLGVVSVGVAEDIISIIQDIKCTEL